MPGSANPINYSPLEILVSGTKRAQYRTLAAALTACSPGDTIVVGPGTYQIPNGGHTINKAGVAIIGSSDGVKFLSALDASVSFRITANDVLLQNIELDGQGALQAGRAGTDGILVNGVDTNNRVARTAIRECYIHGGGKGGHGVHLLFTDAVRVERCRIEGHATDPNTWGGWGSLKGIFAERTSYARLYDCDLTGWSQAIGLWNGVTDTQVIRCRLLNNYGFEDDAATTPRSAFEDYGNGVLVHGNNRVEHCTVDGATHNCLEIAQDLQGGTYVSNTLRNAGMPVGRAAGTVYGACAEVTGAPGAAQPTTDILIQGNWMQGGGRLVNGVSVNAADRVSFRGNRYSDFNDPGVLGAVLVLSGAGVMIEGEQFYNCYQAIFVNNSDSPVTIRGCGLHGPNNVNAMVLAGGSGHLVEGCEIVTDGQGINVTGATHCRLMNNRLTVGNRGIFFQARGCVAMGNKVTSAVGGVAAFQIAGASTDRCTVRENTLDCPSTNFISAGAHHNRVMDNWAPAGGDALISVSGGGAGNVISGNYT